jgi:hypothetical protein
MRPSFRSAQAPGGFNNRIQAAADTLVSESIHDVGMGANRFRRRERIRPTHGNTLKGCHTTDP